ncbi:hypothetical protein ABIF64_006493 [Bradyrhizobium japonicum]|jgi:hypothetical protein
MVRRLRDARCGRAVIALCEERVLLRLESKTLPGRDGVADYFNGLPRWRSPSAVFSEVRAAQAGPDLINMAATISFDLAGERDDLVVKMSWVVMREDGDWKIVNHHASSQAPLI